MVVKIMVPIREILGLCWGSMGDNGKENGHYHNGLNLQIYPCQGARLI